MPPPTRLPLAFMVAAGLGLLTTLCMLPSP